ncbi:hypothetical protein PSTT_01666 [Puccinia striiformis]|uniref:AB hydrolase-1 domain-containing protein n=1 Tax=Puccinia striiformis TaxID=27350 RepID=A0A2S4W2U2_9BASI|nr:hypothetical protein PSTT_01666 [Puccinia striiformis]
MSLPVWLSPLNGQLTIPSHIDAVTSTCLVKQRNKDCCCCWDDYLLLPIACVVLHLLDLSDSIDRPTSMALFPLVPVLISAARSRPIPFQSTSSPAQPTRTVSASMAGSVFPVIYLRSALLDLLLYSSHLVQRRVNHFEHPTSFIRTTINRIVGTGLGPEYNNHRISSPGSSNPTNSVSGSPDSIDQLLDDTLLPIPQIYPSRPSSPSGLAPDHLLPYDDPKAIDFRSNQVLWFQNCPWEELKKENMMEWLAWSLFGMSLEEVRLEDTQMEQKAEPRSKLLDEILIRFENRAGYRLQPGYNPNLANQVIRLTLDPIKISIRPLGLYLLSNLGSLVLKHFLKKAGFREAQCTDRCPQGLKYLIRKPKGWDDLPVETRPIPLIFAHGLGIGMLKITLLLSQQINQQTVSCLFFFFTGFCQYAAFLTYLAHAPWALNKPIVVLIQPSISQEVFSSQHLKPPTKETLAADVIQLIYSEKFAETGVELVGHSMGTIVIAWVVKALSNKGVIKRICLIDPVCFCTYYFSLIAYGSHTYATSKLHKIYQSPTISNHLKINLFLMMNESFLYSKPQTGIERMIRYFVGTELGVAHHLHRYFEWRSNILWPFEIPGFIDPQKFQVFFQKKIRF